MATPEDPLTTHLECRNCGAPLTGPYCAACGEKRMGPHDLRVRALITEAIQEVTSVDSRLWRTLGALFSNPGRLTREYLDGRPAYYLQPIRLYLAVSALFFLFAWGVFLDTGGVNAAILALPGLGAVAQERGLSTELFMARFDGHFAEFSGYLRILSVFAAAAVLKLLYVRTARTYVEHLVTALHYFTFDFAFAILCAIVVTIASPWLDPTMRQTVLNATLLVYLVISFVQLRTVYGQGPGLTAFKAVVYMGSQVVLYNLVVILGAMIAFFAA